MKEKVICGIQQVGIGVPNVVEAWKWYYDIFGFELKIVDDEGVAERMLPYTGGKPQPRRAVMVFNSRGGGGLEIWQPKQRELNYLARPAELGDVGVLASKMKTPNIDKCYKAFSGKGLDIISDIKTSPYGIRHFLMRDLYGNLIQVEENNYVFIKSKKLTGGVNGVMIGVSDMDKSIAFYTSILDYDKIEYDTTTVFNDLKPFPRGDRRVRRVVLSRSKPIEGPLCRIMGTSYIELIQAADEQGKKLYEGRLWGDPGYIHLCFDIRNMDVLQKECEDKGHPFVCDSGKDFDMGDANGHFTYIEDPDGSLIEFVETKRVPIIKKIGWYLDLTRKDDKKPLKILKAIRFAKISPDKIQ